jgi:hypothetical protein
MLRLKRPPDFVINDPGMDIPYLSRWWLIPRNRFFNVYLHKFTRSDSDRALHDHPWYSMSVLLKGKLLEHQLGADRWIKRFVPVFRSARFAHRLELIEGPVWTLFITGPRIREWGFHCPGGWVHWTVFTTADGKNIDKGCGD